jgi:UPF0271 protein
MKKREKLPSIDLNADVGEGLPNDEALMSYISSANICCGFHAGSRQIMQQTIGLCLQYNVSIGAHPGYPDRINFGRKEQELSPAQIMDLIGEQLMLMQEDCKAVGAIMYHMKPHGALYNQSARNPHLAAAIAEALFSFNPQLILFGLSGSCSISEAQKRGLRTASEFFADRAYTDEGCLTPRNIPGALIEDSEKSVVQVINFIENQKVQTLSGQWIPVVAETICLHGDGAHALSFARKIHQSITAIGVRIQSV